MEPLVPPRRAKQRNVRSHALRDELPSKLIRDRNPPRLAEPLCTLPPLTPDFQLRPHPSYTVLFPLLANHQANGINSPPSPRCSSISRARSFWNEKKIFLRLSSNHCWWRADAWTRRRFNWDNPNRFSQFSFGNVYSVILTSLLLIWGRWWKMKIGFSFFFYYCVRKEERKGSWIFEIDIFFWFNFFGRDYATDCNIEFFREDQFFDEKVSWACAILFVYFFVL